MTRSDLQRDCRVESFNTESSGGISMQQFRRGFVFAMAFAVGCAFAVQAGQESGFERITAHYEAIRQALLNDTTEGVAEQAGQLQLLAEALQADAGDDKGAELKGLLRPIQEAAVRLNKAETIDDTREIFGELSKLLVQLRQKTPNPTSVVAFCSMAQKVWLQPKGELGNPYYGQSMATCGEIVAE
jgi:hypothetical protein